MADLILYGIVTISIIYRTLFFGGWNLYAVEGDYAIILQTYETEEAALWVRDSVIQAAHAGQDLVEV